MESTMVNVHLWQEQGLGIAPFWVETIISFPSKGLLEANVEAYNNAAYDACQQAKHYGVSLCSCQSCWQCLQTNVVIRDANKKFFVVGLDCAMKTGDTVVMERAKYLEKKRLQAIKEAKREEAREARRLKQVAEWEAQRQRNGGLTDREVEQQKEIDRRNAIKAEMKQKNGWLIDELRKTPYGSQFIDSMLETLERQEANKLSPRCLEILSDIYAKTKSEGARRGSKKYDELAEEFYQKLEVK